MNDPMSSAAADPPATSARVLLPKIWKEFRRFTSRRLGLHFGEPVYGRKAVVKPHPRISPSRLRKIYQTSAARHLPDDFALYRIIGNDLVPRHAKGQSRGNVAFILENEPEFEACEKRWIINRIVDSGEEAAIIGLLEKHDQPYLRIPFDRGEYGSLRWDAGGLPAPDWIFSKAYERLDETDKQLVQLHIRRHKTLYAMNNNGARNAALADGRTRAKWVLPLDGNCYFTAEGFASLRQRIEAAPWHPYVILSMARIIDNSLLLDPDFMPETDEEPQVVFRSDALECFDDSIPYGRRPKVELLWRLGVPGPWDKYRFHAWDAQRPPYSPEAGRFQQVGWVARLASGRADLEVGRTGFINRGSVRGHSIISTLDGIDAGILASRSNDANLAYYDRSRLLELETCEPELFAQLMERAEQAAVRGPHSVRQKTTLAPSGDPLDYWHPAPYWWPDPSKKDGIPYQWRDGERIPGTSLYDSDSGQFDRTRLQLTMDDSTILALAGMAAGRKDLLDRSALLVRTWFIDPSTRMNPHLKYAQVRRGHNGDLGGGTGIIELKDLHYFLDAVHLLCDAEALTSFEIESFRNWLAEYSTWLATSQAGMNERRANNNHGTLYDVQLLSIALFLRDFETAARICNGAWLRFSGQFAPDGSMPHELKRTKPRHYASFGFVAWTTLARLMAACGENLWKIRDKDGRSLEKGAAWLAGKWADPHWAADELEALPADRLEPFWQDCRNHFPELADRIPPPVARPSPVLHPEFGHAPFWMLAQSSPHETHIKTP
jgi:hypothetical protein